MGTEEPPPGAWFKCGKVGRSVKTCSSPWLPSDPVQTVVEQDTVELIALLCLDKVSCPLSPGSYSRGKSVGYSGPGGHNWRCSENSAPRTTEGSRVIVQVGGKDLSFLIILELLGLHFWLTQVKCICPRSLMGLTDGLAIALLAFPQFNSRFQPPAQFSSV